MAPALSLWERRDDETDPAFEAFAAYRDMGPRRNIRSVGLKLGKSETLMSRWSSGHDWPNRAKAFDRWMDQQATEAWAEKYRVMVDETNTLGRLLIQRSISRLKRSVDEDKPIPSDVIRAAEVAAKIQNMGMMAVKPDNPALETDPVMVDAAALVAAMYRRPKTDDND